MKAIFPFVSCVALMVIVASCKKSVELDATPTSSRPPGRLLSRTDLLLGISEQYAYTNNIMTRIDRRLSPLSSRSQKLVYNAQGKLTAIELDGPNNDYSNLWTAQLTYSTAGKLIRNTLSYQFSTQWFDFTYAASGEIVKVIRRFKRNDDPNEAYPNEYTLEYDNQGQVVRQRMVDPTTNTTFTYTIQYENTFNFYSDLPLSLRYDNNQYDVLFITPARNVSVITYTNGNVVLWALTYKYETDTKGRIIKAKAYDQNSKLVESIEYTYEE